jgi:hypothetical protein
MADRTLSFDRFKVSRHIQLLQSTEIPVLRYQSLGKPPARRLTTAVVTAAPITLSPEALAHRFSNSHASSGETCLDRSGGHSEEI